MTPLDKNTALAAISVLAGKGYVDFRNRKDAVEELLIATDQTVRDEVAADTVTLLLDIFDAEARKPFRGLLRETGALTTALAIAETYHLEVPAAERLVLTTASAGFHGRFPDLPLALLGRPPSAEEVVLLISAYVDDYASRSKATEEKLAGLATAYLPQEAATMQIAMIEKFVFDWGNSID